MCSPLSNCRPQFLATRTHSLAILDSAVTEAVGIEAVG